MSKELSIKKLETLAVDALEDVKGRDIIIVNTTKVSQMFERIVLASGDSMEDVLAAYPHLSREDIQACLAYGAEASRERFIPIPMSPVS